MTGCAGQPDPRFRDPSPAEWARADFGASPGRYEPAIRDYIERTVQDPRNATFSILSGPEKAWLGGAPNFVYGYGVCAEIVERGVYTAHTSFGPTFFLLKDGRIAEVRAGTDGERLCARLGRLPAGVTER
jgi:hypothetical protein